MKKYSSQALFCVLGLVVGLSICVISQETETIPQKPVTASYVLLPGNPKINKFEWRQPLLHPTYPPKLVPGQNEFVLK